MDRVRKYLGIGIFAALAVCCLGEFVMCFARGYSELWYTILVPSVVVIGLAAAAFFTKVKWLFAVSSALVILGAVLLIGFPSYVMYLAIILGAATLIAEAVLLVLHIKSKK